MLGSLAGLNRRTWVRHIPEVSCIFYGWFCHPDFEERIGEREGRGGGRHPQQDWCRGKLHLISHLAVRLRTSWSLVGGEVSEEPAFLEGTANLCSWDYGNIYRSPPRGI